MTNSTPVLSKPVSIGTANDYFGDILRLYDKQQDLQAEINSLIDKARLCPDYEEYKESIESYHII